MQQYPQQMQFQPQGQYQQNQFVPQRTYKKEDPGISGGDLLEPDGSSLEHEKMQQNRKKMYDFYHQDLPEAYHWQVNHQSTNVKNAYDSARTFFQKIDGEPFDQYPRPSNLQTLPGKNQYDPRIDTLNRDLEEEKRRRGMGMNQVQQPSTIVTPQSSLMETQKVQETDEERMDEESQIGRRMKVAKIQPQQIYLSPNSPTTKIPSFYIDTEIKKSGETFGDFNEVQILLTWHSNLADLEKLTMTGRGLKTELDSMKDREAFARHWLNSKRIQITENRLKCLMKDIVFVLQSATILQTQNSFSCDLIADCDLFTETENFHGESRKIVIPRSEEFITYFVPVNTKIATGWETNKIGERIEIGLEYNDSNCTSTLNRELVSPNGKNHFNLKPSHPIYKMFSSGAFFKESFAKNYPFKQGPDGKWQIVQMTCEDYHPLDKICREEIRKLPFHNFPVVYLQTPSSDIVKREICCNVQEVMTLNGKLNKKVYNFQLQRPCKAQIRLKATVKYLVPNNKTTDFYKSIQN